jgi:L-fuconolactonase
MLAGGYNRAMEILEIYTSRLSEKEQDQFFGGNAIEFYNIDYTNYSSPIRAKAL